MVNGKLVPSRQELAKRWASARDQIRDEQLREAIRREAADSVAESLRQHGLVPSCDLPAEERSPAPEEDPPSREEPT